MDPTDKATQLLQAWAAGDAAALEELIPLIDDELRRLAHAYLSRERPDHMLQTTALINEALIRLIDRPRIEWQSRRHFFVIAARVMRGILIEHARNLARKKKSVAEHVPATDHSLIWSAELLVLDEALTRLSDVDERKTKVVELKYFGGLTTEETAAVLNLSSVTVERDWRFARAWLKQEMIVVQTNQFYVPAPIEKPEVPSLRPDTETKLAEAWSNRELVSTLMSENWTGLRLLVQLRPRLNVTKRQLISALETDASIVDSLSLKLKKFGALEEHKDLFSLTNRGHDLLESFENALGNRFE